MSNQKNASIIVATHNRANLLEKTLYAILNQDFSFNFEIIVINDGSTDNTSKILQKFKKFKKIKIHNLDKDSGPIVAKNIGIKMARYHIIVIMDDDCIPKKKWLKNLVSGFTNNVGVVSSHSIYGGTSTAFLKQAIDKVGFLDSEFFINISPLSYREDTDFVFRIMNEGYKVVLVKNAKFDHIHKKPRKLRKKISYSLKRLWIHQLDSLLYKKHPEKTKKFLNIKLGFIRNPINDFKIATGLWYRKKYFSLSSPQGIVLIQSKSILHKILIFLGGIFYAFAVKFVRLYGSIKYKKLLI